MKRIAVLVLVAACSKGDECEQFADKMAPAVATLSKGTKVTPEQFRAQTIEQCRANPKFKTDPVFTCVMNSEAAPADCLAKDMKAYADGAKQSEAKLWLRALEKKAKVVFIGGGKLPVGTAKLLPPGDCCKHEPDHKCAPVGDWAADPVWKALDFEILEGTAYKYTYVGAADGMSFHATAVGDPDCTGTPETWTLDGKADTADGPVVTKITPPSR
ncbi:MAG TPA: hypothetical protein VGM88_31080 [Kofleriaceae bacterium]|jgi:hypothetical protein